MRDEKLKLAVETFRAEKLRLESRIQTMTSEYKRLEDSLELQESESSDLKRLLEAEKQTLRSQIEETKQRESEFESERVALREMVSALREASEREAEQRQERVRELEERVAELEREIMEKERVVPVVVEKKEEPVSSSIISRSDGAMIGEEERKREVTTISDRQSDEREMALERKIQRLERTRKSLSEELVNKEETEREMTEKLQRANRIVQNYKKLRVKHKVLLELLGEREEELDRLKKK